MRHRRLVPITTLLASLLVSAASAGSPGPDGPHAETPITEWSATGIQQLHLPVFHDSRRGGTTVEDLLSTDDPETWATWTEQVTAGEDGTVRLDVPGDGVYGIALATTLSVDRFVSTDLLVDSEHPVRAWLDGVRLKLNPADEGRTVTLALGPGDHRLTISSARDPEQDAGWWMRFVLRAEDRDTITVPVAVGRQPSPGLTIDRVVDGPQVDGIAISPDGGRHAVAVRCWNRDRDEMERWIAGSVEIRGAGGPRDPKFSPRTGRLAWVTRGEDAASIWVDGREAVRDVEELADYAWLPGESGMILTTRVSMAGKDSDDDPGIRRVRSPLDRQPTTREPTHLWHVDLESGVRTRLTAGDAACTVADISPDGTWLVFLREVEDLGSRPFTRTAAWRLDLATGTATELFEEGWLTDVDIAPDGVRLLVQAGPSAFGGIGSTVPEGVTPNDYDGQLFVWRGADAPVDAITRDLDPAVIEADWSPSDGAIVARVRNRDRVVVMRSAPGSSDWEEVQAAIDAVDHVAIAANAPVVEVAGSSPWQPLQFARVEGGSSARAVRVTVPGLDSEDTARGEVRSWSTTVADGTEVFGTVYLPPDFDVARRYPALVYFYGGTSPVDRSFGGRYPKEWWATNGYVVVVLNPAGATGYGQARSAVHTDDWGEHTAIQIIQATERFLEEHEWVDAARVGCLGASYGGFMTMRILTLTDRFAAAVAHAGISALTSYWGEGYWGYSYGAVANADQFPWNRPDVFVGRSPLFTADRVTTPLLLTHGTSDPNVPPGESIQMFTALELLGREVELLEVADQAHWILERDKRLLWSESIVAWFDRWLKDQPAWWFHLWPEDE
jgi:dipeptidyl aminopeptidase/acylaminoacyl peptidase